MEEVFSFDNLSNPSHPQMAQEALEQVKSGNKTGGYPFPKPNVMQKHFPNEGNQWTEYEMNLQNFSMHEESPFKNNKWFDYTGSSM